LAERNDRPADERQMPRALEFALFATAMLWAWLASLLAGRSAAGISGRFQWFYGQGLLESLFLLFLAVVGFRALDWIGNRASLRSDVLGLPARKTAAAEWGSGFAIGWGLCLAAALPVLFSGHLIARWELSLGIGQGIAAAVATLLVISLAEEVIFRGYPFQRLSRAIGPGWATSLIAVLFAVVLVSANPPARIGTALLVETIFGALLAVAYLRTHALWLGWGLHFGYRVVMAVVLGLPVVGRTDFGSLLDSYASGPRWLSGGGFGLDAAVLTAAFMLAALFVLYRVSRDWAWAYTLPVIVPGGYEVVVPPPAAHVAMEKAAAPPPLVQILPSTPQSFSASDPERSS
jgi:membrane protease YdiL (CAAX protease family)